MADRTIDININITGSAGGTSGSGGKGASSIQKEEAKRLTNQLKEEEKRRTLDHAAELKKQEAETKRVYKAQSDIAKKAAKEQANEAKKAADSTANSWSKALGSYQFKFNALGNIVSSVVSAATSLLSDMATSVVTTSKEFEASMSGVKAITNATEAEFKALTNDAIRLGGSSSFTATEVSKLQEELAKLGFTVPEILAATDGVVALAEATGEDLAKSAAVAGIVIRSFNLEATDLSRVVDVMAASFNSSALDLEKFSETIKYVAPVANKTGFSIEEVTAMMAKLSDNGIVASQAGTELRNIFLGLSNAGSKLSKAIGFSANSLPEFIIGLQKLNKEGLNSTRAFDLIGKHGVSALLSLAGNTDKLWEIYESLRSTTGEAKKMSETRMDNFAGSVERLKGAWDSFVLSINKSNGVLRGFVDGAMGLINKLTDSLKSSEQKGEEYSSSMIQWHDKRINEAVSKINEQEDKEKELVIKSVKDNKWKLEELARIEKKYNQKREEEEKAALETAKENAQAKVTFYLSEQQRLLKKKEKWISWTDGDERELESVNKNLIGFSKFMVTLRDRASSENKNKLLANLSELENATEEDVKKWMDIEKVRIEAMADGLEKELALKKLSYAELIKNAKHYGLSTKDIYDNLYKELDEITKKYFTEEEKKELDRIEKIADISLQEQEMKVFTARKVYQERLNWIGENIKDEQLLGQLIEEANKKLRESSDIQKLPAPKKEITKKLVPTSISTLEEGSIWDRMGISDLSSEQKDALKKGFSFLSDQIQKVVDKEKEMADLRVENSERVVDQLQQDLELELQKKQAGYANNVTLKEKELADAKVRQAEALKLQEQAVKKQQQLEAMAQAISLISATANILKNYSAMPIVGQILAIAEIATMWGTFAAAQIKAKELTKMGEGGEIEGKKHSQGGVPINAEGGEYVVKASAYAKNKELVQAINNEDMSNVYRALNQDLSVSLDDSDTARMLGRHFKDKKKVTYFNGYRVEELGNRRRTIRYAKV